MSNPTLSSVTRLLKSFLHLFAISSESVIYLQFLFIKTDRYLRDINFIGEGSRKRMFANITFKPANFNFLKRSSIILVHTCLNLEPYRIEQLKQTGEADSFAVVWSSCQENTVFKQKPDFLKHTIALIIPTTVLRCKVVSFIHNQHIPGRGWRIY